MALHKLILAISLCLLLTNGVNCGCVAVGNFAVEWRYAEGNITLSVRIPHDHMWSAVGFNNASETMTGATIFMMYENYTNEYFGEGYTQPTWVSEIRDYTNLYLFPGVWKWELSFTRALPVWNDKKVGNILLAWNTDVKPSSPQHFEKHNGTRVIEVEIDDSSTCSLYQLALLADSIPGTVILSCFWALLGLLCLILRGKQPLKSRGTVPVAMSIAQVIWTISNMISYPGVVDIETQENMYCIYYSYVSAPTGAVIGIIIVMHQLRFVLITNLNNLKSGLVKQRKYTAAHKMIRFLKFIVKPRFSLAILGTFLIIWTLATTIFLGAMGFSCHTYSKAVGNNSAVADGAAAIVTACCWIIGLIEIFTDVIMNYKLRCNLYKFFVTNDVYLFRVETWITFATATLVAIYFLINVFILQPTSSTFPGQQVIYSPLIILLTAATTVFPCVLTIIWEIKKRVKSDDEDDHIITLERMLTQEETRAMFVEKAKQEWSLENIMIWDDLQEYKQIKDEEKKHQFAAEIYDKYLKGTTATFEVNIPKAICDKLKQELQSKSVSSETMDEIENVVKLNLFDTMSRLKEDRVWHDYLKLVERERNLRKSSGFL